MANIEATTQALEPGDMVFICGHPAAGPVWGVRPGIVIKRFETENLTVCPITSQWRPTARLPIGPVQLAGGPWGVLSSSSVTPIPIIH